MYAQQGQQPSPHGAVHQQHTGPPYGRDSQTMASYGAPPNVPPNHINPNRPEMAPVHPQYPAPPYHQQPHDMHPRLPAMQPPNGYYQPPPGDYRPAQPPAAQSAPRQRTAIACKYCRRRKIRCSGFENSEDGRCTNCARFSQQCIFTPVSAQTQAFVPAQAVYGRGGNPPPPANQQFYGSYGQPLPPRDYGPQYPMATNQPYPPPPNAQPYGYPQGYEPQQQAAAGRRRTRDEPHTPTLPPPNPGPTAHMSSHGSQDYGSYGYPDPSNYANGGISPGSGSYPSQPYFNTQPPASHSSTYTYENSRSSSSPHGQSTYSGYSQPSLTPHSGQAAGRTPPPPAGGSDSGASRNGVAIRDIVSEGNSKGERSAADSDMVSALNRPSRR